MRIGFFIRALEGGGAQRDTVLLANALARAGREVALLSLRPDGPLRPLVQPGVAIVPVSGSHLRSAMLGLRRALLERRLGAIVSSEAAANLVTLLASRLLPCRLRPLVILREVGSPSMAMRLDPYRQNRVAYRLLRFAYRWADAVITLTEGAATDLAAHFGVPAAKLIRMTSNAVIDDAFLETDTAADAPREPGLIVALGRLSPEKDHATLIEAFSKIDRSRKLRLEIVGTGPLRDSLQALIDRLGLSEQVKLTGFVPDPFSVLRRAELAVSSSVYEGFGNAIVEALACGTPVVSTDCPFGPREILQDGRYGPLVPVGDADAMAPAIVQALATPPNRAALRLQASRHTVARAATGLTGIIESLEAGRRRSTGR